MTRFYIFKDGEQIASTATREQAIFVIRQYQAEETHYLLRAQFSIIAGEEEFIPYETAKKPTKGKKKGA